MKEIAVVILRIAILFGFGFCMYVIAALIASGGELEWNF